MLYDIVQLDLTYLLFPLISNNRLCSIWRVSCTIKMVTIMQCSHVLFKCVLHFTVVKSAFYPCVPHSIIVKSPFINLKVIFLYVNEVSFIAATGATLRY